MPPKIECYVLLEAAIRSLEKNLGKMRGGLIGYFKGHPEKIAVRFWG